MYKVLAVFEAIDKMSGTVKKVGDNLDKFSDNAKAIGQTLTGAFTVPIVAIGAAATKMATDFDYAIANLKAQAGNTADLTKLHDAAIAIGADVQLVGVNSSQAAMGLTELYKSGLTTSDIFGGPDGLNQYLQNGTNLSGAFRAAIDLQAASEMNLEESTRVVSISMKQFGLDASDATRITDNLVKTAGASPASVKDLAASLELVGTTFKNTFNWQIEDANVLLGMLAEKGIVAADAGYGLNAMLQRIVAPNARATKAMEELGIKIYDTSGNIKSARDVLDELNKAFYDSSGNVKMTQEEMARYTKLIFGTAATSQKTFNALVKGGGQAFDEMVSKMGGALTTQQRMALLTDTLAGRTEILQGTLETAGITIGERLMPMVDKIIVGLTDLTTAFMKLEPEAQNSILVFAGVVAAAGPVIYAIGSIRGAVTTMIIPAITSMTGVFAALPGILGSASAGMALYAEGASVAEIASLGVSAVLGPIVVVLGAVAAAAIAAKLAWDIYNDAQEKTAEVSGRWVEYLDDQVATQKSATAIADNYISKQKEIGEMYDSAGIGAQIFVDKNKLVNAEVDKLSESLTASATSYDDYVKAVDKVNAANERTVKVYVQAENGEMSYETQKKNLINVMSKEAFETLKSADAHRGYSFAAKEASDQISNIAGAEQDAIASREQSIAVTEEMIEEQKKLRDEYAKWADTQLSAAKTFTDMNESYSEMSGLQKELSDLDAKITSQGSAHAVMLTRKKMSTDELAAAQAKMAMIGDALYAGIRKNNETDLQYSSRMADLRVKYDNLRDSTSTYTAVVGGATKAQLEERQAIIDKMAAIDENYRKQLAMQAVENLSVEQFGTGEAAAQRYEEAKRNLMLATGLITPQALAEQDAMILLNDKYTSGQVSALGYASMLGKVREAAKDGAISLQELDNISVSPKIDMGDAMSRIEEVAVAPWVSAEKAIDTSTGNIATSASVMGEDVALATVAQTETLTTFQTTWQEVSTDISTVQIPAIGMAANTTLTQIDTYINVTFIPTLRHLETEWATLASYTNSALSSMRIAMIKSLPTFQLFSTAVVLSIGTAVNMLMRLGKEGSAYVWLAVRAVWALQTALDDLPSEKRVRVIMEITSETKTAASAVQSVQSVYTEPTTTAAVQPGVVVNIYVDHISSDVDIEALGYKLGEYVKSRRR